MNKLLLVSTISLSAMMLAGCGGGSSSATPSTSTGYFVDSGVEGATYVGDQGTTGTTGAGGSFNYLSGENITFSIGAVTLGSATGSTVVSPIEFGTYSTNVARLLIALDEDGDASNGITLSSATITQAATWTSLDLTSASFNANATAIGTLIGHTLPTETEANTHLNSSLQCAYSGAFIGSWSGTYDGSAAVGGDFGMMVMSDGSVVAGGEQSDHSSYLDLSTGSLDATAKSLTINGIVYDTNSPDGDFTGVATYSDANSISGTFQTAGYAPTGDTIGTLSATRVGGSRTAAYRFTGFYRASTGQPLGVYSLDIDASGQAVGIGHDFSTGNETAITGTATGGNLSLTVDATTTVSGTIDLANGTISGVTWTDGSATGPVTGAGCSIN